MEPIENYVHKALANLKNEVNNRFTNVENVDSKKDNVRELISLEVSYITDMAFGKLIDLKMLRFKKVLNKQAPSKITNFYEFNLREEMNVWIQNSQNKFDPNPEKVVYSIDPAVINGILSGASILYLGAICTYKLFLKSVLLASMSGAGTIILTTISYKYTKKAFTSKSVNTAINDVHQFINEVDDQLTRWIKTISKEVENQFKTFCDTNGINLEKT